MTGKTPRRKANCLFESMTEPVKSRINRIGCHQTSGTCRVSDHCLTSGLLSGFGLLPGFRLLPGLELRRGYSCRG